MEKTQFETLSEKRHQALSALATFRFLTARQFVAVGVSSSEQSVTRKILPALYDRERGRLVDFAELGVRPGRGRFPRVYFLTHHGARIVADFERCDVEEIPYPPGGVQYVTDFDHRESYIDHAIALRRWVEEKGGSVLAEKHYFDFTGSNRRRDAARSDTRLDMAEGFIVPDGLVYFETDGKRRAAAVEVHRHTDPKRCADQLAKHLRAIMEGSVTRRFGHTAASLVFSIATRQGHSERVRQRMRELPEFRGDIVRLFRFASLDGVRDAYGSAWVLADGTPAPLG